MIRQKNLWLQPRKTWQCRWPQLLRTVATATWALMSSWAPVKGKLSAWPWSYGEREAASSQRQTAAVKEKWQDARRYSEMWSWSGQCASPSNHIGAKGNFGLVWMRLPTLFFLVEMGLPTYKAQPDTNFLFGYSASLGNKLDLTYEAGSSIGLATDHL